MIVLSSLLIVTIAVAAGPSTILGIKYLDVNKNGMFDDGDSPLQGWTINLTNSSGLVGSAVTNASGFFEFDNLAAGHYNISEVGQSGYTNTTPTSYSLAISAGKTVNLTSIAGAFGNVNLSTIIGLKYLDSNQNGVFDNNDMPLAGFTINLTNSSGLVGSAVTNASGFFEFDNLFAGHYNVSEVLQPGYLNTTPTSYSLALSLGTTVNITSIAGGFGNINLSTIIGLKYLDSNQNGVFDNNDTPIAGFTINLTNSSGLVGSVVTNASGFFEFDNLFAGHYNVSEVPQFGYNNTTPSSLSLALSLGKTVNLTSLAGAFGNLEKLGYVTNQADNTVSAFSLATNQIVANITTGVNPFAVAVTPDGKRLYVTNNGSNTVTVINTTTNSVITTIVAGIGNSPAGVAITPDGTRAYVTNFGSSSVSVINTSTNTVITVITAGIGNLPFGLAITPDGTRVYVAEQGSNDVSVINTLTNTVFMHIPAGNMPIDVAITPDGTVAYVSDSGNNRITVINTISNLVITTIIAGVGNGPHANAVLPNGTLAYTANINSGDVTVVNTMTNTVVDTIPTGAGATGLAISPDGSRLYVANSLADTISVIDTATSTVIGTINTRSTPRRIAINPDP